MKKKIKNIQYAGTLGHYGSSLNDEYNKIIIEANKLVDKYNKNVTSYETIEEQVNYQEKMVKKINKIIKKKNNYPSILAKFGYYGVTADVEANERSILANVLIDDYNRNVATYETHNEQVKYQAKMVKKIEKTIKGKK